MEVPETGERFFSLFKIRLSWNNNSHSVLFNKESMIAIDWCLRKKCIFPHSTIWVPGAVIHGIDVIKRENYWIFFFVFETPASPHHIRQPRWYDAATVSSCSILMFNRSTWGCSRRCSGRGSQNKHRDSKGRKRPKNHHKPLVICI